MRVAAALAAASLEHIARALYWLENPRVFPWFVVAVSTTVVGLMILAYAQRGGLC